MHSIASVCTVCMCVCVCVTPAPSFSPLQLLTQIGNWDGRGVIAFTAPPSWRRTRTESVFFVEYQWMCSRYWRNIYASANNRPDFADGYVREWTLLRLYLVQKSIAYLRERRISCHETVYRFWFSDRNILIFYINIIITARLCLCISNIERE